jgi:hypothetical protein
MVTNPGFDANTTGWSFANKNGAASTVQSVAITGSSTNVGKVTITNLGTTNSSDNVQLSTNVFIVKDRNYLITFKAHADASRAIGLRILQNASPFSTIFSKTINITGTQATYGFYAYTSTYTGSVALRFFLGNSNVPVYFDDVEMIEELQATLPVSLMSFTGSVHGDIAILNWKTSSEINTQEFEIEKSNNGTDFIAAGKVQAKNVAGGSHYSFSDNETFEGLSYYRLKSVDKDGQYKHSPIITLRFDKTAGVHLKLSPNPATAYCTVSYPVATANAFLTIYHADGRKTGEYNIAVGSTQRSIDVSKFTTGYYFIVYRNNGHLTTSAFVKTK